jgi:lipoprotein-releasing system permease protein
MHFRFALRYFKAKKTANAINIIAWVTVTVIAFATCCQILVLSVFNGFEDLVKSLYSSFYSDLKMIPATGKTFTLTPAQISEIKKQPAVAGISMIAEEKALLQNEGSQTVVSLKGVDENYKNISGVPAHISSGKFETGNVDSPRLVLGYGVEGAVSANLEGALQASVITVILPKKTTASNVEDATSEGNVEAAGIFSIQQEIDNEFAITDIGFVKRQIGFAVDEYSAAEIKLRPGFTPADAADIIKKIGGAAVIVQDRYQQNANLYSTMRLEKWAVYAILTLILIIAAFNMVSALTMLVLEKRKDISILRSMGTTRNGIRKIFLSEGLLLGLIGAGSGILLAVIFCLLQTKFHLIKLQGGSFLIDYFPVKMLLPDFLLVACTAIAIAFIASWFPANKASGQEIALK